MPPILEPPVAPATPAPTETPAAPAAPAAPPAAPDQQLSEEARGILHNIFALGDEQAERIKQEEKSKKAAAAKPAEPPKAEAEEPAKVEEEKPKGKPTARKQTPPPAVDPVELAVTTARETARAMGAELGATLTKHTERREADRATRTETAATEALTPKQKSKHEVLVEMAKLQPDRYATLPTEYIKSLQATESYKAEWLKQNSGKRWDENDGEHDSFFEAVEPIYDEDDYSDTRQAIRNRPLEEKLKAAEQLAEKVAKFETESELRKVEPAAFQAGEEAAMELLRQIDPALPGKVKTQEDIKALKDADPEHFEIVEMHARRAGLLVGTGVKILESQGKGIDRSDPVVVAFFQTKNAIEQQIKSLPKEDQLDPKGRRFATWDEWIELNKTDPNPESRYWFLDQKNLPLAIPAAESRVAKGKIAALESGFARRAAALGYTKNSPVSPATPATPVVEPPAKPAAKPPESPSAPAGKVQLSTSKTNDENAMPEWKQRLLTRFIAA